MTARAPHHDNMGTTLDVPYPAFDGTQPCIDDPQVFFPENSRASEYSSPRARAVCAACPFRRDCLAYAIANDVHGYWGGTSRDERKAIRKEHGIRAHVMKIAVHEEVGGVRH